MKSMTGYGYTEYADEKLNLTLEIKSYNNKYLDIYINLPPFLSPLEPDVREFLNRRIPRGKVECSVRLKEMEEDLEISIDKPAVSGYFKALSELKDAAGINEEIRLSHLLRMDGVLKTRKNRDIERYGNIINRCLEEAFSEYNESKIREGKVTEEDLLNSLKVLEEKAELFAGRADQMEADISNNIRERFKKLLEDSYDENRVLAETALLLMKYSINEEIVRLRGHLVSFRQDMKTDRPVGKKLDFLCQEIGREINTIGSKSNMQEVIQGVVESKDCLDRIREQLRNCE